MPLFPRLPFPAFAGAALLIVLAAGFPCSALAQPQGGIGIDASSAVAVVVKVPKPWYAPRSVVVGRMRDTVPQYAALPGTSKAQLKQAFEASVPAYRNIPGLLRKYFIVTDDGKFGGIYLWKDQASAQQWFSEAWKERVLKTYGSAATLEWFDTPILLPSQQVDNQPAIPGL